MSFASKNFPDVFAFVDDGIAVGTMATGTTSGSPILIGGPAPLRKLVFIAQQGSGTASTGVVTFSIYTASTSGGPFASFSTMALGIACSQSMSISAPGKFFQVTETRGEALADLGTNALWVKPVFAVATTPVPLSLTTLGFVAGVEPASAFNSTTLGGFQYLPLM